MRFRNPKDKNEIIANCNFFYDKNPFLNDNPLHLEIGIGKGNFLLQMALIFPNINFVGVEKNPGVAALAIKKLSEYNLANVRILISDAKDLKSILKNKISLLYLNFSDPWPKRRHENRRLTSPFYLNIYEELFAGPKIIIQKTDNIDFFNYSYNSLLNNNYKIKKISYDLHHTDIFNVMTEYEEKFLLKNIKIKYLMACKINKSQLKN